MSYIDENYNDVPSRIREFRAKHPNGSLQSEVIRWPEDGFPFIAVEARAYRTPDDPRPGVGLAFEPIPGKTNFTRDSELQNAETSAWGRAIVAVGAADTKKGIASADEVAARTSGEDGPDTSVPGSTEPAKSSSPRDVGSLHVDDRAATGDTSSAPANQASVRDTGTPGGGALGTGADTSSPGREATASGRRPTTQPEGTGNPGDTSSEGGSSTGDVHDMGKVGTDSEGGPPFDYTFDDFVTASGGQRAKAIRLINDVNGTTYTARTILDVTPAELEKAARTL